jgi:hypothetical protein
VTIRLYDTATREVREMDVFILTAAEGEFPGRNPTVMSGGGSSGRFSPR